MINIKQPPNPHMGNDEIKRHFDREAQIIYQSTNSALSLDDYFEHNNLSSYHKPKDVWVSRIIPNNPDTGLKYNTKPVLARLELNNNVHHLIQNSQSRFAIDNYHIRIYGNSGRLLKREHYLNSSKYNQLYMFSETENNAKKQYNYMLNITFHLLKARFNAYQDKTEHAMIDLTTHIQKGD